MSHTNLRNKDIEKLLYLWLKDTVVLKTLLKGHKHCDAIAVVQSALTSALIEIKKIDSQKNDSYYVNYGYQEINFRSK